MAKREDVGIKNPSSLVERAMKFGDSRLVDGKVLDGFRRQFVPGFQARFPNVKMRSGSIASSSSRSCSEKENCTYGLPTALPGARYFTMSVI